MPPQGESIRRPTSKQGPNHGHLFPSRLGTLEHPARKGPKEGAVTTRFETDKHGFGLVQRRAGKAVGHPPSVFDTFMTLNEVVEPPHLVSVLRPSPHCE